jgi:hypothetical protein
VQPDAESKGRLLTLLRAFPRGEPTRKKVVNEMIAWSSRWGEFPAGDPEIHHVAGTLFAEGAHTFLISANIQELIVWQSDLEPYDAERHLILGSKDSPETLASLEYAWYEADESHTAPLYAARGVLPYLITGNLRAANKFFLLFSSKLSSKPSLSVQEVSTSSSDLRVYPSLPLLNFLGLLLLSVQRGDPSLFRQLKSHYAGHLKDVEFGDALDQIGEMYFGIKIPRQGNPMMDMIGNMFMGGGLGGGGNKKETRTVGAPAASGLD